jgi:hypothetical protein
MNSRPRILLIHATPIAMEPIRQAFESGWPEAEAVNLLEDSLSEDRAKSRDIPDELTERFIALTHYAKLIGSDAVLFTCSAFSKAIEVAAAGVDFPVLKPNEAMFEAAIRKGGKTAMLYTFPPSREGMEQEFREEAQRLNPEATITSLLVEGAVDAIRAGDVATHNSLVAAVASKLRGFDAITLAHFSTARARAAVETVTEIPVMTSPDAAVAKLRSMFGADAGKQGALRRAAS